MKFYQIIEVEIQGIVEGFLHGFGVFYCFILAICWLCFFIDKISNRVKMRKNDIF